MKKAARTHAVATLAVHDMNGFATLGPVTLAQYDAAPEVPQTPTEDHSFILDLWDSQGTIGEKFVSLETMAGILGWPAAELIQRGRQMLAQDEDEAHEELERRARNRAA